MSDTNTGINDNKDNNPLESSSEPSHEEMLLMNSIDNKSTTPLSNKKITIISIILILSLTILITFVILEKEGILKKKKTIYLIGTGGTIASTKKEGHLTPTLDIKELLKRVPALNRICKIEGSQLFNKDSTNIKYSDWEKVAQKIKELYTKYDGFVIAHGTDTMAYGSAIMSYFIQNSSKPIIFVGSQKSIEDNNTDAKQNLYDSFVAASSDKVEGVKLVFNGEIIDGFRAKKLRSVSYNAFSSIDIKPDIIVNGEVILSHPQKKIKSPVSFNFKYEDKVFVLQFIPGIKHQILDKLVDKYKVIILEGFGMGGVPNYNYNGTKEMDNEFIKKIKDIKNKYEIEFIAATQIIHEGTHLGVYQVGNIDLIETYSMTIEAVVGKCVWILGQIEGNMKLFRKHFETQIGCDRIKLV